jgi:hypothetical protein
MNTPILSLLCAISIGLAGCTTSDENASDGATLEGSQQETTNNFSELSWWWTVNGAGTIQIELEHPGGNLAGQLTNSDGALASFRFVNPANCEGGTNGGSTIVGGSGGGTSFDIDCPDVEAGIITVEIELSGEASGRVTFENVRAPDSTTAP